MDINGPNFLATLYAAACDNNVNEQLNLFSPSASLAYPGSLRLWKNAHILLNENNVPENLELKLKE